MARDRIEPCIYYLCLHECKKGRAAEHNGYCQHCDKYEPRVRRKHPNAKKATIEKMRSKDQY